ncbi:MAG: hypothetical protein ACRDKW_13150 [Actinomycetota bacterium]
MPEAPAGGYLCDRCGRLFATVSKLRVHAVVDERRPATAEERRGSRQMSLPVTRHVGVGSPGEGRP